MGGGRQAGPILPVCQDPTLLSIPCPHGDGISELCSYPLPPGRGTEEAESQRSPGPGQQDNDRPASEVPSLPSALPLARHQGEVQVPEQGNYPSRSSDALRSSLGQLSKGWALLAGSTETLAVTPGYPQTWT